MPPAAYLSMRQLSRKKPRSSRKTSGSTIITPGSSVVLNFTGLSFVFEHAEQVLSVTAPAHRRRQPPHAARSDVSHALSRNLFDARNLQNPDALRSPG